ncbi:uncharacterized protein LDX57_008464 [Aspergillus melleus]|uniref:uncharacterized protein n=1 Tax=Aspergillus melleus TaxID=138277 RepID=UPI001E8E5C2E|nr:uncharacterized protein LDX57_008464 [Aspergillus melleus]KAH8430802.1 hypothetical protein LDX57_008464 [Aspergillus melleus]
MSPQAPKKTDTGQKHHTHTKARPDWKRSHYEYRYHANALLKEVNALMVTAVQNQPELRSIARHARKLQSMDTSTLLTSYCDVCELKRLTRSQGNGKKDSYTQSRIDSINRRKELMDVYNNIVDDFEGLRAALIERYPDVDCDSRPRIPRKRLKMCEACALKGWDGVDA